MSRRTRNGVCRPRLGVGLAIAHIAGGEGAMT
jgi:hypothetical protein